MAFDHENHTIDPATGFQVHKETGQHIGVHQAPVKRVNDETDWPKWVTPHADHIHRQAVAGAPDHISVPAFPHFHVNRADGSVTVMVANEEEEAHALAGPKPKEASADASTSAQHHGDASPSGTGE
jgi:hypothetical protein